MITFRYMRAMLHYYKGRLESTSEPTFYFRLDLEQYYSLNQLEIDTLEKYCFQFADKFFLGDVVWISWLDFLNQLPEKNHSALEKSKQVLRKNRRFELLIDVFQAYELF